MQRNFLVCTSFAWNAGTVDGGLQVSAAKQADRGMQSGVKFVKRAQ